MEFKEVVKIRSRMCDYYKNCDGCPLGGVPFGCISGMAEVETADQYERILNEWTKEHPVMTNADKFAEVMKNTFGEDLEKTEIRGVCVGRIRAIKCIYNCEKRLKWWDEEYKEPEKEKEE